MTRFLFLGTLTLGLLLLLSCNIGKKPEGSADPHAYKPELVPVDSLAIQSVVNLYNNLYILADSALLIGHQDALAYGMHWKGDEFRTDINDVCGDFPAIFGWDLGHIGDIKNIDSVPFDRMRSRAIAAYEKGGINTYSWHMRNIVSGSDAWDITPAIAEILPGGDHHEAFLAKLDMVADFFSSLKTGTGETVPLIFRPWHEMNHGWFWWGTASCTPEEYKSLYRFTVDYLNNTRDLHNILYAFSPDVFESEEEYLTFYPGDDYVDILGLDNYAYLDKKENAHRTVAMLEILEGIASDRSKPMAITETGLETIPNPEWFTNVVLSAIKTNPSTRKVCWVLFWRNGRPDHFYAPYPGHSSAEDFIEFKNDKITFFLSDIQHIYIAGGTQ